MISCKNLNLDFDVHISKFLLKLFRYLIHTIVNMCSSKSISSWGTICSTCELFAIRIILRVNGCKDIKDWVGKCIKCERSEYKTFRVVSQLRLVSVTRKHLASMPRNNSDQLAYYRSCYGDRPCYGLKEKLLDIDGKKIPQTPTLPDK